MAFGSWDDVIRDYEMALVWCDSSSSKRLQAYYAHATAMLDLIPQLRNLSTFRNVKPGTSHLTLFFQLPENRISLNVWYEGEGNYLVYLYRADLDEFGTVIDKIIVNSDMLLAVLQDYLKTLQKA
jgi:hypothetical protein